LGGTETALNLWSKPAAAKIQELAESGWEKPTKAIPAFELADLSGMTWRLKNLEGRAVLINVWATWCGPCQRELPHMEKGSVAKFAAGHAGRVEVHVDHS
jgi:thiol-disulfide isomerase/thioredoxin